MDERTAIGARRMSASLGPDPGNAPRPEIGDDEIDLGRLFVTLWKGKLWIILGMFLGLAGGAGSPNRQELTAVPLTLIEAFNAAAGFAQSADRRRVSVQRGGHLYHVDVEGFLATGLQQNNLVLRNGDVIYVLRSLLQRWNDTVSRLLLTA